MFKKIILDGETTRWSINENGKVRNDETGKFLTGTILHTYRYINFRWNGKQKNKAVHRLVAETFLPNPENLSYVHHIDGNRLNNKIENLMWATGEEIQSNRQINRGSTIKPIEYYDDEIWKSFRDGKYEVSNYGKVKNNTTGYVTYGSLEDCGYRSVRIKVDGDKARRFLVHQLVYECFISPEFDEINHINGNKEDNRVENLENVTHKENMIKATYETNAWNFRKVAQYDKEGNLIHIYANASEAGRAMGILPSSMRNCIRLRNGHHKNFIFKYIEDEGSSTIRME